MGRDHRDQPVVGLPHDAARGAGDEAQGWGRIINTASAHSLVASPNKSAYVAAKHGIAGFTKTVALETARDGITANCISPGYVWTPLVEKQIPDTMKARGLTREQVMNDVLLAAQPTKQFVTPEQVAALALFLCRDEARVDHRRQPQHGRRLDGACVLRGAQRAAIQLRAGSLRYARNDDEDRRFLARRSRCSACNVIEQPSGLIAALDHRVHGT